MVVEFRVAVKVVVNSKLPPPDGMVRLDMISPTETSIEVIVVMNLVSLKSNFSPW